MSSSRYVYADEVLPALLVKRCQQILEYRSKIISFSSKEALTKSEKTIGALLTKQCRKMLKTKNGKAVNVLFRGQRLKQPRTNKRKEVASWLVDQEFSAQSVADALGTSRESVAKWRSSKRLDGCSGHEDYGMVYHAMNDKSRGPEHENAIMLGLTALLMRSGASNGWRALESEVRLLGVRDAIDKLASIKEFEDEARWDIKRRAFLAGRVVKKAMEHTYWHDIQSEYGKWRNRSN